MRKLTICKCRTKGVDQQTELCSNSKADQHLCFRYTDFTIPLHSKSLAVYCACTTQFVSDLFGNKTVSHNVVHMLTQAR